MDDAQSTDSGGHGNEGGGDAAAGDVPLASVAPAPLVYQKPPADSPIEPYVMEGSVRRHVVLPLVLVCAGTVALYGGLAWRVGTGPDFARIATLQAVEIVASLLIALITCAAVAGALDVTFGLITPAVAKLAAVVVAPAGVASLAAAAMGGDWYSVVLGWMLAVIAIWVLFIWLFDSVHGRDAAFCCLVLTTLRVFMLVAIQPF